MSTGAGAAAVASSALARGAASGDPVPEKMVLEVTGARLRGASFEAMAAGGGAANTAGADGDGGGGANVCGAARAGSADTMLASFSGGTSAGLEDTAGIDAAADGTGTLLATSAGGSLFAGRATVRSSEAEALVADETAASATLLGLATGA